MGVSKYRAITFMVTRKNPDSQGYNTRIDNLFDTKLSSHYCFERIKSKLSTDLLARANALHEAILIGDGIFALSNVNHLSISELNYLIESLAIDLN